MDASSAISAALPRAMKALRTGIRRDRANAYALREPWTLPPLGGDLPELGLMPPAPYADERIRVWFEATEPTEHAEGAWRITVLPWELDPAECDGCTMAPDSWGELKLYVAALFHDRWYLSMESIAKAWGWDVARVRKLGDIVFATILVDLADAWARDLRSRPGCWIRRAARELEILGAQASVRLYYRSVRAFGGIAHEAMKTSSPGGDGGSSPHRSPFAPLVLAGLFLFSAGCAGGCAAPPSAWDGGTGIAVPAHSFTNTVTGAHFEATEHTEPAEPAGGEQEGAE